MRKYVIWTVVVLLVAGLIANGSLMGLVDSVLSTIYNIGMNIIYMVAPILIIAWIIWRFFKI